MSKRKGLSKLILTVITASLLITSLLFISSAASKAKLNYTSYTLVKGQSFNLILSDGSKKSSWKNSDTKIMSLSKYEANKYTITGKTKGSATVTVKSGADTLTCKVKVVESLSDPSFTLKNTSSGVTIEWKKVTGATSYKIYRKTGSESFKSIKKISGTSTLSYTDKDIKSGKTYKYKVKAIQGGYSSNGKELSIMRLTAPSISLSASDSGVKITWKKVSSATSYKIYRKADKLSYSRIKTISSGDTTSYTDKSADDGRTYYYYIVAVNGNYKSDKSTAKKIKSVKEKGLVACFKVDSGKAIDTISGKTIPNAKVVGNYFKGGTINLPSNYTKNWTIQFVVDYNESSKRGLMNYVNYFDDILRLEEVLDTANRGKIRIYWVPNRENSVRMTVPVQLNAHASCSYEFLPTSDIFWAVTYDISSGKVISMIDGASSYITMPSTTDSNGKKTYSEKNLWQSFTLNKDHKIKELKIYSRTLTKAQLESAFKETGIKAPTSAISKAVDGLSGFGTSYFFSKTSSRVVTLLNTEIKKGTYTVSKGGLSTTYSLVDYKQPDNKIDNSKYSSLHITNAPKNLEVGKQYPLTAIPYPFNIKSANGKADEFDVIWSSSDKSIIEVMDGLLVAKKAGTAKITAKLIGTSVKATVSIKVTNKPSIAEKVYKVPTNYKTKDGYTFSKIDYKSTTLAIYSAIDYAAANGYTKVVFPKQNYYATPLWDKSHLEGYTYYVPSGITIEFSKGSVFYMKDSDVIRSKTSYNYFYFGVPYNDYTNTCSNSNLIMDKYYGERYKTKYEETDFSPESRFVCFGRKSCNCSVEISEANYTTGYFINIEGKSSDSKVDGKIRISDLVTGKLDKNGTISNNKNWISTRNYIKVPDYKKDGYFLSSTDTYWNGCVSRTYDIYWFDSKKELIKYESWLGKGEYYFIPQNAEYFKLSLQQQNIPDEKNDDIVLSMHDDGSSKMCEIRNTRVYNSGSGIASIVGESDGFWIHNCIKDSISNGIGNGSSIDFENGWCQMRHSIISNCYLPGYFGSNGGYNTFIHTNYIGEYSGFSGQTEMLRFINNTTDHLEIAEKNQAHLYYNTYYDASIKKYYSKSFGHIYTMNNKTSVWVNAY